MNKSKNPLLDESASNEYMFKELLKKFRPDLFVLMDLLDSTKVSYYILFKIIRHLKNIDEGTGHGKIEVDIVDHSVTYISGNERDKLLEPITKKENNI